MKYSCEYKKQCVELCRQGKWPETQEGVSADRFHHTVVEWHHLEKACGTEALRHKKQNKVWTAEEKYELVAKVLADASYTETAIAAGIDSGLLYRWVRCYKMKGHAVDVRHLQQFTGFCSAGFFFRASILSGHIFFLHPDASILHLSGGLHNYRDGLHISFAPARLFLLHLNRRSQDSANIGLLMHF